MVYRGNVMEVRESSLVVMLEDCTFRNVKKFKGLEEGMEIYFEDRDIIRKSNFNFKNISLVAAAILLFVATSFYGISAWDISYRAVALISVDINPSVELKINRNHNVIRAIALNEDAKNLPLNNLKNQPLDEALETLVNMARLEGYIKEEEENYILVTSVDLIEKTKEKNILTDLISNGKAKIETSAVEAGEQVEVISIQSNKKTLKEAKKENISVGKKEINQNINAKQEQNIKKIIEEDEEKWDKHLEEMRKEANELQKKLKQHQNLNNKHNNRNNNDKNKKELNQIINSKQEQNIKRIIEEDKEKLDKHLEEIRKEANELQEKLRQHQNLNNKHNSNNDKHNNEVNEFIKQEKDKLKERFKQEEDKAKEEIKQHRDEFKDEREEFKDKFKKYKDELKKEEKNKKNN